MAKSRTKRIEEEIYNLHREESYNLRKIRPLENLTKEAAEVVYSNHFEKTMALDTKAREAGLSEEQVGKIVDRARFDALLQLSDEGDIQYKEVYIYAQRSPENQPGEYDIVSQLGDYPNVLEKDFTRTTLQFSEQGYLVNAYYKKPMEHHEIVLITINLISEGVIGNFGQVVPTEE